MLYNSVMREEGRIIAIVGGSEGSKRYLKEVRDCAASINSKIKIVVVFVDDLTVDDIKKFNVSSPMVVYNRAGQIIESSTGSAAIDVDNVLASSQT